MSTMWQGIDLRWAYGGLLDGVARQTRCMHRAKDALHDAFLRFCLSSGVRADEPEAYFRRVVQSVLADQRRQSSRQPLWSDLAPAAAEHDASDDALEAALGSVPSAESCAELRQRLALLQRVVDSLPARCREVFWLFRIEGCSQGEIASRLGLSVNMVERHVMRALVDLRAAREALLD